MTAEPTGLDDRLALLDDLEREARRGPVYTRIKEGGFVEGLLSGEMSQRAVAKSLGFTATAVGYAVRAIRADRLLAEVRDEEGRSTRCEGWGRGQGSHRTTDEEIAGHLGGLVFCVECEETRQRDREARNKEPAHQPLYARSGDVVTGSLVTPSPPPAPSPLVPRPWWEVVRSFLATKPRQGTWCLGWNREPHEVADLDLGDDGYELCSPCRAEAELGSRSAQ